MITFKLNSGLTVVPTSFHGSKFSDGTIFTPSQDQIDQIKADWSCLTVKREFYEKYNLGKGCAVVASKQTVSDEGLEKLRQVQDSLQEGIILVSFMLISALKEMGIRDEFPKVVATNATEETCRSQPQDKIWDIARFAY